ncbi:SDR family oxidoreductase [Streptomyces ipomoeae]|uniref:SDR family oxidoreductase n=1 Tax=Streptomyces ipomoeae TaxID=103232 RepID=UPI0011474151|nr:SDR family oxidoreductase [Streptomyces ipomoeae]MDX2937109.1 SDR family oxidoreductase [Streptomyces ipomoeae]TQE18514.1 SDR family oxidoreductase [Streptomyces ipomoeae]
MNNVGGLNNATYSFLDIEDTEWTRAFDINLLSTVRATRAALPSLIERHGTIVNISSAAARILAAAPATYSSAKAALTALGKSLAEEFGPRGVRVNTISPGLVRTSVYENPDGPAAKMAAAAGMSLAELAQQLVKAQNITTGRMTEADEVAALIAFLLSDVAGNITSADYVIDGGTIKTV